ncbi:MAG: class I SAM-dependent methyltransferase [Lutibacter sp.]|uniref:class I SAM-dependent methyltransferase n=1 Tax=Lutibacter sp. TaxID=1925666 RepID=UPI00385FA1CA
MVLKIKNFLQLPMRIDKLHRSNDDAYAMQIILKLFPEFAYLPFTPFSLNPYTIVHILNDILLNNRKQIVEFGSGISTIIIARFVQVNNLETKILSIDNNMEWKKIISKELEKYNCKDKIKLVVGELKEHHQTKLAKYDNKYWYDFKIVKEAIDSLDVAIDLVVVDGPSTGYSIYSRYPAIPLIKNKLAENVSIFLDDTRRKGEKEILVNWNKEIAGELQFEKMYGVIKKGNNFSSKPLSH